ncbi:putative exo-beta-1,3-glucanase [Planoprotostelium fungivorum]|uniref:glucan endo-1,3-beta-D-glucosidase n=1 Tax=Planoprotostelium fungivorum TaxID=1890364 RepID=A0A2P6MNB0_9EUKA|nr:putative exo-beta-1,3-glucanase [Planoprotostelium fungivorum]
MATERGQISGLCFSPYLDGQSPAFTHALEDIQIDSRLSLMSSSFHVTAVRTYGSRGGLERVPHRVREMYQGDVTSSIGAWLCGNEVADREQIEGLVHLCNQLDEGGVPLVNVAVVGNEVLLRGDLSEEKLIQYIQEVRKRVPQQVQVTTAEPYGLYYKHPKVLTVIDIVYVHIYAYWDKVPIEAALDHTEQHYNRIVSMSQGKEVVIAEIGWPTAGEDHGAAAAGLEAGAYFFKNFVAWADHHRVEYFYFEAFDEGWKVEHEGERGAHWGVMDSAGKIKSGFETREVFGNRSGQEHSTPSFSLLSVPSIGSRNPIRGRVYNHHDTATLKVATFINVDNQWWVKPTLEQSSTFIRPDGSFEVDVSTGENDVNATEIAVFLLARTAEVPRVLGSSDLPELLFSHSLHHEIVDRSGIPGLLIEKSVTGPRGTLEGKILDADPFEHRVALYIKVGGGWWTKPTFAQPTLFIEPDRRFKADIFSGDNDATCSEVAVFLIDKDFTPPRAEGHAYLPHELYEKSVTHTIIKRS